MPCSPYGPGPNLLLPIPIILPIPIMSDTTLPNDTAATSKILDHIRVRSLALWGLVSFLTFSMALGSPWIEFGTDISGELVGIGVVLFTVGGWLAQAWWRGLNLSVLFGPVPTRVTTWGLVLLCVFSLDILENAEFYLLLPWFEQVVPALAEGYTSNAVEEPSNLGGYLWLVGSAVVTAPLIEEFLFRGVIYQRWAYAWGTPIGALLATACLFSLPHGHFVGTFTLSVVATILYAHTQSLWAPIAMHAIGNAINVFGGLPLRKGVEQIICIENDNVFGIFCFSISVLILGWFFYRFGGALYRPLPFTEEQKVVYK